MSKVRRFELIKGAELRLLHSKSFQNVPKFNFIFLVKLVNNHDKNLPSGKSVTFGGNNVSFGFLLTLLFNSVKAFDH